jgi:ribosomal protein S18 acetylase RimI-like enzyme
MKTNLITTDFGEAIISQASYDDVEEILDLWLEAAKWIQSKGINQWPDSFSIQSVEKRLNISEIYIVKQKDTIIASLAIQWSDKLIWKELDNDQSGYIHRLIVRRAYSGRGIGNQLLEWAGEYIKANGKSFIRLDCMADNEGLNQYYSKIGFNYKGRVEGKGWAASLFERQIN